LGEKIANRLTEGTLNEKDFFRQFGYDGLGEKASEALQPYIDEYTQASFARENDLSAVTKGSGVNITVRNILDDRAFYEMTFVTRVLFDWHFEDKTPKVAEGELKGTVIVTGSLPSGKTKKKFGEFITQHGYKMVTTSKQAGIVISSPTSTTAKAKYARDNNLPLITEDQFYEEYLGI